MKTLGIIGGLGPQTTADFYMRIHTLLDRESVPSRPSIIINSVPITKFLETENIIHERQFEPVLPYLTAAASSLDTAGADFIVLACNSLHIFEDEIQSSVSIPFISIVDATVKHAVAQNIKKVGILGTHKTNSSGMYSDKFQNIGIEIICLSAEDQKALSTTIIRLINGTYDDNDFELFERLVRGLIDEGAESVILACTDFHLLLRPDLGLPVIDSNEVLAQHVANLLDS